MFVKRNELQLLFISGPEICPVYPDFPDGRSPEWEDVPHRGIEVSARTMGSVSDDMEEVPSQMVDKSGMENLQTLKGEYYFIQRN